MKRLALIAPLLLFACQTTQHRESTGPWDMKSLRVPPAATWGTRSNLVQEVYYEGEPFHGKPTRIFAYVGRPEGKGPFPGVVLVHGGEGKAFSQWAERWAKRGYVSIAMDTAGAGPNGRLSDGGPDQSDTNKFRNFTKSEIPDMWTYHAVAAAIRGHSLLLSLPEVDRNRTALTGISWGGYLTCIIAGVDHRFKAAVPVYGCGFLGENSYWKPGVLAQMNPDARALWLKTFDPSQYLADVSCPILFLNGTHDFAYPLDSYQKCYHLVKPNLRRLSVVMKLPHGHIFDFKEPDAFIDAALSHDSFPKILNFGIHGTHATAEASAPVKEAQLNYTTDAGPWDKRTWTTINASIDTKKIDSAIPQSTATNRDLTLLITAKTSTDLRISSEYIQPNSRQ
ncbi:MAG TPA: acetylxylan esterase [Verrucomicrobiae bacterium]